MSSARQTRLLEDVLRQPGNEVCADCKAPAPRWASVNHGIFLCVQCASVHRKMGTHLSRVKSVTMDFWQREDVEQMRSTGNLKANSLANPDESRHPPPTSTSEFNDRDSELEKFIRNKWEKGLFRADPGGKTPTSNSTTKARTTTLAGKDSQDILLGKTKESPLPDLPPPPTTRPPVFGSNGRLAAKQHVQSNWDEFIESSAPKLSITPERRVEKPFTMKVGASAPVATVPQVTGNTLVDTTVPKSAIRTVPVVMANTGSSWPPPQQQQEKQPQYMIPQATNPFNGMAYGQFQQQQPQSFPQFQLFNPQQVSFPSSTSAFPLAATSPYSQFANNQSYFQQPMGMQQPQQQQQPQLQVPPGMYMQQQPIAPPQQGQWVQQGTYGAAGMQQMPNGWR